MKTNYKNYQDRYEAHQARKKIQLENQERKDKKQSTQNFFDIVAKRRSDRIFEDGEMLDSTIESILKIGEKAPSSCNRNAIYTKVVYAYEVGELLVGGKGWASKADRIILLFANMEAYKSPNEVLFMPYLDAGVKVMMLSLACEAWGIRNCIINPNIRPQDNLQFNKLFNKDGHKFCVALAIGL